MLPNFIIMGAMKSGTTSLYAYLKEHPDVFMSQIKEPNYFCSEKVWQKGIEWYESLFKDARGKKAIGEASVSYTKYPHYLDVPQRIYAAIPDVKLIYVLRAPVDRVYSHYLHNVYAGIEDESVLNALSLRPLYIQTSLYYSQIQQYLEIFKKDQLKIIILDDLKNDPLNVVQEVFKFINVDDSFIPPNIHEVKHQTKSKKGRDNVLMKLFRKAFFYSYLNEKTPHFIRSKAGIILKNKVDQPDALTDDVYNFILDKIMEDMNKLSLYLKRDLNFWDLQRR